MTFKEFLQNFQANAGALMGGMRSGSISNPWSYQSQERDRADAVQLLASTTRELEHIANQNNPQTGVRWTPDGKIWISSDSDAARSISYVYSRHRLILQNLKLLELDQDRNFTVNVPEVKKKIRWASMGSMLGGKAQNGRIWDQMTAPGKTPLFSSVLGTR